MVPVLLGYSERAIRWPIGTTPQTKHKHTRKTVCSPEGPPLMLLTLFLPKNKVCDKIKLQHVRDVHGHLVDLRGVVLFDVSQDTHVVGLDEVDRHTLASESPRPSDTEKYGKEGGGGKEGRYMRYLLQQDGGSVARLRTGWPI